MRFGTLQAMLVLVVAALSEGLETKNHEIATSSASSRLSRHRRTPDTPPYQDKIPSAAQAADLVQRLSNYDFSDTNMQSVITEAKTYLSISTAPSETCVFYAGLSGYSANNFAGLNGKTTVGSAYYGYGQFPFNPCIEPFQSICQADTQNNNDDLKTKWFRATSVAFAQICEGIVFLVSDSPDWVTSEGSGGSTSIFATDEMPAMQASSSAVTEVRQVCDTNANLWNTETSPALIAIAQNLDICAEPPQGQAPSSIPYFEIYNKATNFLASN